MKWRGRKQSGNVEDRRGKKVGAGIGVGSLVVILIVWLMGGDPGQVLQGLDGGGENTEYVGSAEEEADKEFVSVVLQDTEDVWNQLFQKNFNKDYPEPTLVLFNQYVQSACGTASSATGPFYCPGDGKVYIDLSFYDDLQTKLNAPGDFAMAYVIAHEVGHHVQNLLGATDRLQQARGRVSEEEYNRLSVMLELQADFYAGVWAHHAQRMKDILDAQDIEEALNAANAIGDDRLQKQSQGYVVPESFTHGTSAQRMRWFKKGFETGDIRQGNTFEAAEL